MENDDMNIAIIQAGWTRFRADRNGAIVVEFALTAPILFLFLFAGLEFGRYNMISQTVNNAAFEAARHCIVPGATAADGQTAGMNVLTYTGIKGGTVSISPNPILNTTTQVTATVSVPRSQNLWFTPMFTGTGTATKTYTMTTDWVYSAH
jgi:Flp pilus assembly protein TadG